MLFSDKILKNIEFTFKWILTGVLIGAIGGLLGAVFHISLDYVTICREQNSYLLYFLPFGGIAIAFLYNLFRSKGNIDLKRVFQSVREDKDIPMVMMPLIFTGTLITHIFGGSAGREGAALQLGGSMGYNLAKKLKKDEDSTRWMVTAGMSSVFSAVFGVPFAATVFSLEVTKKGKHNFKGLFLGFISSVIAFAISRLFGVEPVRFNMPLVPQYQFSVILKVSLMAVLCAVVCIVFATAIHKTEFLMKKYISNCYVRAAIGGLIIILLTVGFRTTDYNGAGMEIIKSAISGEARNSAFIMKILFTAITVAAGFKGGEIVPTFFIGATFGCYIGGVFGFNAGLGASVGLIAMFAGMTKCPIASLLLAIELFGIKGILFFAISILITFLLSGRFGLYENAYKQSKCSLENNCFSE